jgi:hypothetical protein
MIVVSCENPAICQGYDPDVVVAGIARFEYRVFPGGMVPAIGSDMNTTESMVREIAKVCLARGYDKARVLKMVATAAAEVGQELGLSVEETKALGWKVANDLNTAAVSS